MNSEGEQLAQRVRQCAAAVGGGDALAQKTAIPRRTLESYLTGTTEPKASRLVAIARAANVSLEWLLTGEGTEEPAPQVLKSEPLEAAIRIVERWLDAHRRVMQPEKKAAAILAIYEMIAQDIEEGRPPLDERRAGAILKLVA